MKTQKCTSCGAMNELEFSLRAGNTEQITIRCKHCKKLMKINLVAA